MPPPSLFNRVIGGIATIMMPALMILAAVLARSNVKAKLGDHQGAFRIGAFAFVLSLLSWMLGTSHVEILSVEVQRIFAAIGSALFDAGLMWVTYLGLEPYIRRYAPDTILGWTRLLAGKWNDPRVAVDVIIGVSAGLAMTVLFAAHNLLPPLMGHPEPTPISSSVFDLVRPPLHPRGLSRHAECRHQLRNARRRRRAGTRVDAQARSLRPMDRRRCSR